ncbi:phospholipase D-like domain-containing protein [Streptomyces lavendulocolor]|uniref:phospholipase D-like domain-containing protein n=1 Tax=Streptomyces lavendulocolor TaxID=67316 RepID=UPI003C30037E
MKITKSKFGTFLAAFAVGAALTVAPSASASATVEPTVTTGAIFNNPTGIATGSPEEASKTPEQRLAEKRIKDHLLGLIEGAEVGSYIRISVFLPWDHDVSKELVEAHKRGVNVQVIAGDGRFWAVSNLQTELAKQPGAPDSWIRTCKTVVEGKEVIHDACLAKDSTVPRDNVNHQKFFLFSRTKGTGDVYVDNVVVQSSGNLTDADFTRMWNDALTVVGNSALHDAYKAYFAAQKVGAEGGTQISDYPTDTQAGAAKVYFFPKSGDDTIVNILKTVIPADATTCGGNTAVGTKDGRTKIRIAQGHTTRPEVAKQLWELAEKGCHIEIVYRSLENWDAEKNTPYSQVSPWLTRPTTGKGRIILHDLANDERGGTDTHTKYLLIEGTYYNGPNKKIVFTGSHTYTENALRYNDEALLKYEDPAVFDAYVKNFEDQRAASLAERNL